MIRRCLAAFLLTVLALVAGCRASEPEPTPTPTVEVAGEFGIRPTVTIPTGFSVTETTTATLIVGEGPTLKDGDVVLIDYYAVDVVTGEVVADTFATLPEIRTLSVDSLGEPLYELLAGQSVGSRLERVELGSPTNPNPHVLVVDVRPTRATGDPVAPEEGMPTVTLDESGAPTVAIPDATPSASVEEATLINGSGVQVVPGESLIVQLVAVRWADGTVVDTTWGSTPRAVSLTDLGDGLSAGLVEQRVGSQVVVVVPPDRGNGVDTLVYVVDILATAAVALPPSGTEGETTGGTEATSDSTDEDPAAPEANPSASVNLDDLTGTEESPTPEATGEATPSATGGESSSPEATETPRTAQDE